MSKFTKSNYKIGKGKKKTLKNRQNIANACYAVGNGIRAQIFGGPLVGLLWSIQIYNYVPYPLP